MSTITSTAEDIAQITIVMYSYYGLTALVVYEYLITAKQEFSIMWHRRWTLSTLLFFFNRYMLIAYTPIPLIPTSTLERFVQELLPSCHITTLLEDILYISQYIIFALFSALRVYALRSGMLAIAFVLALSLVPAVVNIVNIGTATIEFSPALGGLCGTSSNLSSKVLIRLTYFSRLSAISADVIVVFLTWDAASKAKFRAPVFTTLFCNGAIYFIIFLLMNIAQMIVDSVPSFERWGFVASFIPVLTPIMISRFLLNLRQIGEENCGTPHLPTSNSLGPVNTGPIQTSVIGNLDEPLEHEQEDEEGSSLYVPNTPGGPSRLLARLIR